MSFLAPLYALGLLAISLPVIFHLIRRQPRGQFDFSSLMFLSPSPPRLARRSRLDHWLLLLLRGLALSLLAFAFARPFLRSEEPPAAGDGAATRAAILIDTSASMRRGDLWQKAVAAVDKLMADRRPQDQVALFACDDTLRPIISFENMSQIAAPERRATVASRLKELQPTWAGSHLGHALSDAVELVNNAAETRNEQAVMRRIFLVSDLQEGARFGELSDFPWPEDVELELHAITPTQKTNAGVHYVANNDRNDPVAAEREMRVRVSNDSDSAVDDFQLTWLDKADKPIGDATPVNVPPGESRIIRVPRPHPLASPSRLQLTGDNCEFDNSLYLATPNASATSVVYLGDDRADDPKSPRFYLERALTEGLAQSVTLVTPKNAAELPLPSVAATPLAVVAKELSLAESRQLRKHAEAGGAVLVVLRDSQKPGDLATLLGTPTFHIEEAPVKEYTMLGHVDFSHPLFARMADPHFNDFTQIHFWKYRRVKPDQLGTGNVIARFENGDSAVVEWRIGKGRAIVLTSGWHPADSQLARSWKFVLLVSALMNESAPTKLDRAYFTINEPVPLGAPLTTLTPGEPASAGGPRTITTPNHSAIDLKDSATTFSATDQPGIYTISTSTTKAADQTAAQHFAVNLDPLESKTAAVGAENLEQLGCRLVKPNAAAQLAQKHQHVQDAQLESRQKIWQWLVVGVLGILIVETWLAGRAAKAPVVEGTPA